MDKYVCPENTFMCNLSYIPSKKELRFTTKTTNNSKPWKDTKFVIFPIFDGNGNTKTVGYVIISCNFTSPKRHYYLVLCYFESKGKEEELHIFSLDSLHQDHSFLPVEDVVHHLNRKMDVKKKITRKKNSKIIPLKVRPYLYKLFCLTC
jgi:hypothetical protein